MVHRIRRLAPGSRAGQITLVVLGVVLLLGAVALSAVNVDSDLDQDFRRVLGRVGHDLIRLRWQYAAIVVFLAGLHYVATAIAAQAAAGVPLPAGENILVQLAAAAANRLTPAGVGSSAVNARYFVRRGLDLPAAVGAVAALAVLGAIADFLTLLLVIAFGHLFGLRGAPNEISLLTGKLKHLVGITRSPWLWAGVAAALVVAVVLHRRPRKRDWRHFWEPALHLRKRPLDALRLMVASGSTTLILAFAFVATTSMVPAPRPAEQLGGLIVGFLIASAAGSAVPVPAGLGSTETAMVAVLVAAHVPTGSAVEEVLIFRLITFWLPAVVGVLAARRLRRANAL